MEKIFERAVACHNAGDLKQAQKLYRRILKSAPNHPVVLNLAGVAAFQASPGTAAGKSALAMIARAIKLKPDYAEGHYNYANILWRIGRPRDAAESYRTALGLQPKYAEAHNNLGNVLRELGRPEEALASWRKLLALGADFPEAHNNIGLVLTELGQAEAALASFEKALAARPGYAEAHNNKGLALQDLERPEEALACFEQAVALDGGAAAHNSLAFLLEEQGRTVEAVAGYEKAIAADPGYAKAHYNLGNAMRKMGALEQAAVRFERALAVQPDYVLAHNNLGLCLQEMGRLEEARGHYLEAIAADPDYVLARANLSYLKDAGEADGDGNTARMAQLLEHSGISDEDAIQLHFALGRTLEKSADAAQAFAHIIEGSRLKRQTIDYDIAITRDRFARAKETFDEAFLAARAGAGEPSRLPVFIVGMPRSGTTLVEQILASHGQVHGAGERLEMNAVAAGLAERIGAGVPYPECAKAAEPALWGELGAEYAAILAELGPDKARVCDKLPGNFVRLGLIALMLPNATIIHCRRDPMDTCYSCYSLLFASGQPFAYDMTELGLYYREYEDLMRHWHALLPGRILDVQYEDVVADLEGQARRLVAHCGLDWDPRCLEFHRTEREVRTASLMQVRQPIYASSLGRWRRHEDRLAPLIEALGPLAMG